LWGAQRLRGFASSAHAQPCKAATEQRFAIRARDFNHVVARVDQDLFRIEPRYWRTLDPKRGFRSNTATPVPAV